MCFELECARCNKAYRRRNSYAHACEFVQKDDPCSKAYDIRALAGQKIAKRRKRRCWTPSHAQLLRVIVDVFGKQHLPVSLLAFEFTEEFLQRKAEEMLAQPVRSVAPSPAPFKSTQQTREDWKATPNLSTADKNWQITPRFTPRLAQISCPEAIRFTPESFMQLPLRLAASESTAYNPFTSYNACKFPDITSDAVWEERAFDAKPESRWECAGFPSPMRPSFAPASPLPKHHLLVSPLMLSVKATPRPDAGALLRSVKPVIQRL